MQPDILAMSRIRDDDPSHREAAKRLRMRTGDYWKAISNARTLADCELEAPELQTKAMAVEPRPYMQSVAFDLGRQEGLAGRPRPKLCEVCDNEGTICFDHCHATEKFRGWICLQCNLALGLAKDNPATLRALADYLDRFKA